VNAGAAQNFLRVSKARIGTNFLIVNLSQPTHNKCHRRGARRTSEWTAEVDAVSRYEWDQMLEQFDDATIYQSASYGKVRWGEKNVSRLVLKLNGEALGLAQLRIFRPTRLSLGIAYLGWGPLIERRGYDLSREVASRMACCLEEEYCRKRKLFLGVAPNALAGSPRSMSLEYGFRQFSRERLFRNRPYRTSILDLSPSLEDLRRGLDRKWRNHLTQSEKNNLNVITGSSVDEFKQFCSVYDQMLKRKAFKTNVDPAEFCEIQQDLDPFQRMRVFLCVENATPVAGVVASIMGGTAISMFGATTEIGLRLKASYFLQWALIRWLKEYGVRWYDLGGIDPEGNPGGYYFKRGLSGVEVSQTYPFVSCQGAVASAITKAALYMYRVRRGS
jgi:lipid II:glycine glycyltransferase (peptidoglycan interpeptide bridge formation enzyme)